MSNQKTATIIGSGLVGSLWAVYLAKAGYKVTTYDRRSDLRNVALSAGKSINLATSFRGWKALDELGIGDAIREIAIPMYSRTIHALDGTISTLPYGKENQAIYSVSRGEINAKLLEIAGQIENVNLNFDVDCVFADTKSGKFKLKNNKTGEESEHTSELLFATDGAFSAVRYHGFQKLDRFSYSQNYIEDGYREILLPANEDGTHKLEKNSLHIWPRGRFMLIALPNFDGSFTCTLFMPFDNHEYCFNKLTDRDKVEEFFKEVFPDFYDMMPNVANRWEEHPLSALALIRCYPWTNGKMALMGDAAHATVPFYGQGMNCGFEDCTVMWELMQEHGDNWPVIFKEYEQSRKPNCDAMQDLSIQNYIVMRDKVTDPMFKMIHKIEHRMANLFPDNYIPLYSMVSFSNTEYKHALKYGNEQQEAILNLIEKYNLNDETPFDTLDELIFQYFKEAVMG
ncbi:MAG: FAD-dependent monooxygenase [Crocinitomicaceae bacterium]|nr:FAD-dependent monooxygenase [Crocinitomicaceae bacterium]